MHNMVYLIGRIVHEIEVKNVGEDKKISVISIAVQRPYKNEDGEYETDFFDIVLWDAIANNVCTYCTKGDLIGVKGRLQQSIYETEDGIKHNKVEIVAEKVSFLSSKKQED